MAAYNGIQWIQEQVDSIHAQQGVSVTLFVSVDLSTDGTDQWVQLLEKSHSNVVMLPYGERFGGAGPNFFRLVRDVDFAGYDAVAFADQDDIWLTDKLQRAFTLLQAGTCDVYSSNVTAFWPDGKKILIEKSQPQKQFDHFFEAAGPGCTYVFNAASALAFKGFVCELGERIEPVSLHDWLAYAFCRDRGFTWFIDERPSMLYRQHGGNQVGTNTGLKALKKRLEMVNKYWYRQQVELIAGLVAPQKLSKFKDYIFRIRHFYSMRRRTRDVVVLFAMFLFGFY